MFAHETDGAAAQDPTMMRIRPERLRCDCGKPVINHHWLCDGCWGARKKKRVYTERKLANLSEIRKKRLNELGAVPQDIEARYQALLREVAR